MADHVDNAITSDPEEPGPQRHFVTGDDSTRNEITGGIFFGPVLQGRDFTVRLPPEITPAMDWLPTATPSFTGRDAALDVVLGTLAPNSGDGEPSASTVVVTAISGPPGVGKTELALQAARVALDRGCFPGGVLFIDLFGYDAARRVDPGQALDEWLRALGIADERIPAAVQDRVRLYTSVLAAFAKEGRRVLVVADNAATMEQVSPLLPVDGMTGAIVTSRHTLGLLNARRLDLDFLTTPDAVELLRRGLAVRDPADSRVTDHPGDATTIAELCGRLPLALQIIAALLAEDQARPLASMAGDLSDTATRLREISYGTTGVQAAFDLSYRDLDPDQARLFRLLPVNPGPEVSTDAAAALTGLTLTQTRHGLKGLARAHLIGRGTASGRWRMHDLIRLYADQHGQANAEDDDRAGALTRVLDYYLAAASVASDHLKTAAAALATDQFPDRAQALEWLDAEYPNLIAAVHVAASGPGHLTVARDLGRDLRPFLDWRHYRRDWLTIANDSLAAARQLRDRAGEATALNDLGTALRGTMRFEEAVTACQNAVTIYREGRDRHGESIALLNLGSCLLDANRPEEAITACWQGWQICRETADPHGEVDTLVVLGFALRASERLQESLTTLQQALQTCREIGYRHGERVVLNSLGVALREAARTEEAITACQDAATIAREIGSQHGEGAALANLGSALLAQRRFQEAITACQGAAAIFRENGNPHGEGLALHHLGLALSTKRRWKESVTASQAAAALLRESDRVMEGKALFQLAVGLHWTGRFEEAATACQQCMQVCRETGDRQIEGMALSQLGSALFRLRRFRAAFKAFQQAKETR